MGLDLGGDDYMTKPFKLGVLFSRLNALLRRAGEAGCSGAVLASNGIELRLLEGQASKNGAPLELTAAETRLLSLFLQNPNIVLTKQQILSRLWDCEGDYIDGNTLTVYIRRLRCKIEDDPSTPKYLRTVRGVGYRWKV